MTTPDDLNQLLQFTHLLSKLKTILRFKDMPYWEKSSVKRWESDAEHMYRMAMLAILLYKRNDRPLEIGKLLKIILFHDCVEIVTGDEFPFQKQDKDYGLKDGTSTVRQQKDLIACESLATHLPENEAREFRELVRDFIDAQVGNIQATEEATFAVALDRIEATLTAIEYWNQETTWDEKHKRLQLSYMKQKIPKDNFLLQTFCELIEKDVKL